jgi:hypothetical protein
MTDIPSPSFSDSANTDRHHAQASGLRHSGYWLTGLLVLAAFVSGASALALTAWVPREAGFARPLPAGAAPVATTTAATPPPLPGFQKKGNLWIGEVRTADGAMIRLVIDARSQAIIGHRVMEAGAPPAGNRP